MTLRQVVEAGSRAARSLAVGMHRGLIAALVMWLFLGAGAAQVRPLSLADVLKFKTFVSLDGAKDSELVWDPSGSGRFLVIEESGDIERDRRTSRLLLFDARGHGGFEPTVLALQDSEQRAGIEQVRWLDPRRVAYIRKSENEPASVRIMDLETKVEVKASPPSLDVAGFALSREGAVFVAHDVKLEASHRRVPIVVGTESIEALMGRALATGWGPKSSDDLALFHFRGGVLKAIHLESGEIPELNFLPVASPDGRFVAVTTAFEIADIPAGWKSYFFGPDQGKVAGYRLIDLQDGSLRWVVDKPAGSWSPPLWDPRTGTLITGNIMSPGPGGLGAPMEYDPRSKVAHAVAVSGRIWWDRYDIGTNTLIGRRRTPGETGLRPIALTRCSRGWCQERRALSTPMGTFAQLASIEQALNSPPKIVFRREGRIVGAYDPNAYLQDVDIASAGELRLPHPVAGIAAVGLFTPSQVGTRHPIVVQTHGWNRDQFMLSGPASANFAARLLATRGFIVLQLPDLPSDVDTEGKMFTELVDAALDEVVKTGSADTSKIGIQGWSRTGFGTRYALVHSRYAIKAADLYDTTEAGYFEWIFSALHSPPKAEFILRLNGGRRDDFAWAATTSTVQLRAANVAVRLVGRSPVRDLETYVQMKARGRPVEMVIVPDAAHDPVLPSHRRITQGGAMDWFLFWLADVEDQSPEKERQFARWRELRRQSETDAH